MSCEYKEFNLQEKESTMETLSNLINATYINGTYSHPLTVNDKVYPNIVGAKTEHGYYKNGHEVSTRRCGKKGRGGEVLTWVVYTARGGEVDVEHTVVFRKTGTEYKLVSFKGFDGVNLMELNDSAKYLTGYLHAVRGEHKLAEAYM